VAAVFLIGWWVAAVAAEENDCRSQYKLSDTPPPHDYGKTLLLWASTRWPQLLDESRSSKIVDHILGLQQEDGGWSIHRFAKPEEWGDGLRAEKLRSEPDFESAPSDGHMTGLAVITLLDAGVPAEDPQIQKGVEWLKKNQRESGRWWTRSLNTDSFHFITFSSTLYALVSLDKSGALVQ
jgi:squalene-hopene/tetraprenyl-beta-curcumene cyclase